MHKCSSHSTDAKSNATNGNPVCYMGVSMWQWRHYPILGDPGHTRQLKAHTGLRHSKTSASLAADCMFIAIISLCTVHTNIIQNNIQYTVFSILSFHKLCTIICAYAEEWTAMQSIVQLMPILLRISACSERPVSHRSPSACARLAACLAKSSTFRLRFKLRSKRETNECLTHR